MMAVTGCSPFGAGLRGKSVMGAGVAHASLDPAAAANGSDRGYSPAIVMFSTRIEPQVRPLRTTVSLPMAAMPRNMSLQVAGDGDLLHRVADLAALDPVAGGAARVVAGDQVDALAEQLGHQQPAPHLAQHAAEIRAAAAAPPGCGGRPRCRCSACRACARNSCRGNSPRPRRRARSARLRVATPSSSNGAARHAPRLERPLVDAHAAAKTPACRGCRRGTRSCGRGCRRSPPETKCPIRPIATGASNSTGAWQVAILRAPRRASARCAGIAAERARLGDAFRHARGAVPVVALHEALVLGDHRAGEVVARAG